MVPSRPNLLFIFVEFLANLLSSVYVSLKIQFMRLNISSRYAEVDVKPSVYLLCDTGFLWSTHFQSCFYNKVPIYR